MKKVLVTLLSVALAAPAMMPTTAFGRVPAPADPKTEAQLVALEKGAWEAYKQGDGA